MYACNVSYYNNNKKSIRVLANRFSIPARKEAMVGPDKPEILSFDDFLMEILPPPGSNFESWSTTLALFHTGKK